MPAPMDTPAPATLHDFSDYRRRKALRDCGRDSRPREFLWVQPASGIATVAVFRPALPSALAALRAARAG
ncbi:MAG: hypothetical protein QM581_00940 [Pseudomonas sp.]